MATTVEDQIDRTISSNDGMVAGDVEHYFSAGRSAMLNIKWALSCALKDSSPPRRILDFPCGHGRVLRYLRAEFPQAEITACDLLRDGVDFSAANFGAIPVYSDKDPARIGLPRNAFDLIWVGSLFTHFDAARWAVFLVFLRDLLRPDGVLVFSTHGGRAGHLDREPADLQPRQLPAQAAPQTARTHRLRVLRLPHGAQLGISIALPVWVCSLISSIAELRLVGLGEKSWDHHHDIYACVRDTSMGGSRTSLPVPHAPGEGAHVSRS